MGLENITYRLDLPGAIQEQTRRQSSRTIAALLPYKLARENLPIYLDIKGIAPTRDCGRCGRRHDKRQVRGSLFCCPMCGIEQNRHLNTAHEVARRVLWSIAQKAAPKAFLKAEVHTED